MRQEKECVYCENDDLKKIIIAPDGEVVRQKCGSVLGRLNIPVRKDRPTSSTEEWSGSRDDAERTLEDHVSRYGWDFEQT